MFFSQNVFSKPWNHFGNDDDSITYRVSQQILDFIHSKYFNFRAKNSTFKSWLLLARKFKYIWEKFKVQKFNFGAKIQIFWTFLFFTHIWIFAPKLTLFENQIQFSNYGYFARKFKYVKNDSESSKDLNFGAKIQHSNRDFWRENSNMKKIKKFEFWCKIFVQFCRENSKKNCWFLELEKWDICDDFNTLWDTL